MRRKVLVLLASALAAVCGLLAMGKAFTESVVPGALLVASDKLGDPNFAQTVVYVIKRDDDGGTLGVVLNREADMTLSKAFPSLHATTDPIYEGGPVSPDAVLALLRTPAAPSTAEHVAGEIYWVTRKALLDKSISERLPASKFRVYLGYAGWGPGQLEAEIRQGAWNVISGSRYVFDNDPDTLWQRLNRNVQSQLAQLAPAPSFGPRGYDAQSLR